MIDNIEDRKVEVPETPMQVILNIKTMFIEEKITANMIVKATGKIDVIGDILEVEVVLEMVVEKNHLVVEIFKPTLMRLIIVIDMITKVVAVTILADLKNTNPKIHKKSTKTRTVNIRKEKDT